MSNAVCGPQGVRSQDSEVRMIVSASRTDMNLKQLVFLEVVGDSVTIGLLGTVKKFAFL